MDCNDYLMIYFVENFQSCNFSIESFIKGKTKFGKRYKKSLLIKNKIAENDAEKWKKDTKILICHQVSRKKRTY